MPPVKQPAIYLNHIYQPRDTIDLDDITIIRDPSDSQMEEVEQTFSWWEMRGPAFTHGKRLCAYVTRYPTTTTSQCIESIFALATNSWSDYLLCRNYRHDNPAEFTGIDILTRHGGPAVLKLYKLTISRLDAISKYIKYAATHRRICIALERWHSALRRSDPIDIVLDLCSCLEACFALNNELRVRLSIAAYTASINRKPASFANTYTMYGIRNEFIHGSKTPDISKIDAERYIATIANVLQSVLTTSAIPRQEDINSLLMAKFGH